jgi:hypothetical protein
MSSAIVTRTPPPPEIPLERYVTFVLEELKKSHALTSACFTESNVIAFVKNAMLAVENIKSVNGKSDLKHRIVVAVVVKLIEDSDLSTDVKARLEHFVEQMLDSVITTIIESCKNQWFVKDLMSCCESVKSWFGA